MQINKTQNCATFRALQVKTSNVSQYKASDIAYFKDKLANTKLLDAVIDTKGWAINKKGTDILQRIQSLSLLPLEKAVSINLLSKNSDAYKIKFNSVEEAEKEWEYLSSKKLRPGFYADVVLWLEQHLNIKK